MSLKSLIESHASSVFLNPDQFAEEVIRHPSGDLDSEAEIALTANVVYDEPNVQLQSGEEIVQRASVTVSGSAEVNSSDQWTIGGIRFQTTSIGPAQGGLRPLRVEQTDQQTRKPGSLRLR